MTGSGNNTYLIAGAAAEASLIDAGVDDPRHIDRLTSELRASNATLARVLVTHGHADHASGAPALAAEHPSASFAKHPWPSEDAKYPVTWRPLADGDRVGALTVLHTPGHSPDHLAFWHEESATIFSDDLVVLGSSMMIHWSRGGRLAQYRAALERLRSLAPRRLLPAHGPAIEDPGAVLSSYLDHRLMRERQVVAALKAGLDTVERIAGSIYDGLDPALLPAAYENVRAHLEKLQEEERAMDDNGRWRL